ncbi:DUF4254 domain-containing protein [Streptomyces sp. NPDC102381]|uniref:DUF4254 domain-containing protein n=1 Tax=Streptomyces sp. NPDC102381 TaxID=3366164 RepID=UPI0038012A60
MTKRNFSTDYRVPQSRQLLERFATCEPGETSEPVLDLACRLRRQHAEQWSAEDLSRNASDNDQVLAEVKRRIDHLNVLRAEIVEELDEYLEKFLPQEADALIHTETIGSIIDRICIAWVRADNFARVSGGEERAALAERQLRELAGAYDVLVQEVRAGRRRTPQWRALKSYGEHEGAE